MSNYVTAKDTFIIDKGQVISINFLKTPNLPAGITLKKGTPFLIITFVN